MFDLCKTCSAEHIGNGYLVQKPTQPAKFYSKFADIKETELQDSSVSIMKVSKSEVTLKNGTVNGQKAKFIDKTFSPDAASMGKVEGLPSDKWRRVSDLVQKPILFPKQLTPQKVTRTNYPKNQVYQAALAALAENPETLKTVFAGQDYTPNGVYNFFLKKKGAIQEVVIDDYLPINGDREEQQVWAVLLEKARAKLHGSYQNMQKVTTTPRQVWQELTFAPSDQIRHSNCNQQQLWSQIKAGAERHSPMCGLSNASQIVNWLTINLSPNHYYTIIDAAELKHNMGSSFQVIKLRNAFKNEDYKGEGSYQDTLFWEQLESGDSKKRMLDGQKEGVIYVLFSDYLKYFSETFINHLEATRNYLDEPLKFLTEHGLLYDITILKEGVYAFSIDQDNMQPPHGIEYQQEGWSRTSLLLARNQSTKNFPSYVYVDGALKYNEEQTTLRSNLTPGKYILLIKIDPTLQYSNMPEAATLTAFSHQSLIVKQTNTDAHPHFLKQLFSAHARQHKRQLYNSDLMWSAWRLFARGGYAYIAFGNAEESKKKFVVKYKKGLFQKANYVLEPQELKGDDQKVIEVLPGSEEIVILRIKNSRMKEIKFPPPIDLQVVDLSQEQLKKAV